LVPITETSRPDDQAFPSPHDGPHLRTLLQLGDDGEEPGVHVVVEGVALLGIVVGDDGDRPVHLEKDFFCHVTP
jgi:hypothetical protein